MLFLDKIMQMRRDFEKKAVICELLFHFRKKEKKEEDADLSFNLPNTS